MGNCIDMGSYGAVQLLRLDLRNKRLLGMFKAVNLLVNTSISLIMCSQRPGPA